MRRGSGDRFPRSLAPLARIRLGWQWCVPVVGLALIVRLCWLFAPPTSDLVTIVDTMRAMTHGGISEVLTVVRDRVHLPWEFYLLLLPGWFSQGAAAGSPPGLIELMAVRLLLIFTDVLATAAIYRAGRKSATAAVALAGALLYALWPGGIYVDGWWGQTDIWYVVALLAAAWWLAREHVEAAWLALALGMAVKWQAVIVLPLFVVGTWRWYGWRRLARGALVAGCVWAVSAAPIVISGEASRFLFRSTVQNLPSYVVDKAHNFWFAAVPAVRAMNLQSLDTNPSPWGASFHDVGLVLAIFTQAIILGRVFWRSGPQSIAAAGGLAVLGATMFLTQTSTRHYLAAPAFFLLAGLFDRKWWGLCGLLAATQFINLVWESGAISPLWSTLPVPGNIAVVNAWCNLAILLLGLVLFVRPLMQAGSRQAKTEGALRAMRPPFEPAALGLGLLGLIGIAAVVFGWGGQLGKPLLQVRGPYLASLQEALPELTPQDHILAINWPDKIVPDAPSWLSHTPMTLPALRLYWPDILIPNTQRVQFGPWQGASPGTRVEFQGDYAGADDLRARVLQADRVIDFHPATSEVYLLAERAAQRQPAAKAHDCPALFNAGVCLAATDVSRHGSELRLNLTWEILGRPARDVTVFVHVTSPEGEMLAQADGDPVQNVVPFADWPAEKGWLREARWMPMPAGNYQIWVGLYNRATGETASLTCSGANSCSENSLMVSAFQGP